jgi:hypothetical protein
MHDVQPDPTERPMLERLWHGADDHEAELLPQVDGRRVRLDNGVELHGRVSVGAGEIESVLAERAPDPRPRASAATMKLAVPTCEPRPGRLGPTFAVPRIRSPSTATTVCAGAGSTQTALACSSDQF